jgi:hypothetical protein
MIGTGTAVSRCEAIVDIEALFVSIECDDEIAQVAHEGGQTIQWQEVSRSEAELLVRAGVRSELQLHSGMRIGIASELGGAVSSRWSS